MSSQDILNQIPVYIAAVGALGVAAFGAVEAIGKTLFVFEWGKSGRMAGLPFAGYGKVRTLAVLVGPALEVSYGRDYQRILRQQYRAGRGKGQAPETIRQGVRLGLPFLDTARAVGVIKAVWGLPEADAEKLAAALTAPTAAATAAPSPDQALAARFATALDTRVQAAFDVAEQVYQTRAQIWAAVVAVGLSLLYQGVMSNWAAPATWPLAGPWILALVVGLVAVPLAPAAKDLSSSISDALAALGKLRSPAK